MIREAILLLLTYLFAGIPFGYLIGRVGGVDVRRHGSGNIGATNVLRTRGKTAGALTLLLDILKGAVPVLVAARMFPGNVWMPIAAAFIAVAGHCFSIYLGFRGGKGVATALGAFLVLQRVAALGSLAVFAAVLAATRMVALGSTAAAAAFPLFAWLVGEPEVALGSMPGVLIILWRHRDNLRRIRAGTEHRVGNRGEAG